MTQLFSQDKDVWSPVFSLHLSVFICGFNDAEWVLVAISVRVFTIGHHPIETNGGCDV